MTTREEKLELKRIAAREYRKNNPQVGIRNNIAQTMRRKGIDPPEPIVQPDRLLETIYIKLPDDQMEYLKQNQKMNRYELYKAFKKHFKRNINKLQFNFNLMKVKEEQPKVKGSKGVVRYQRPDVEAAKNVHWISTDGIWDVMFKENGKNTSIGRYMSHEKAKKVAEEYRNNLA